MFTGIIESVGTLVSTERVGGDARLRVSSGDLDIGAVRLGDSIATNGVCLTVTGLLEDGFIADASRETLSRTTLGELKPGTAVNLERALTLSKPLGGHLVSGHVDGVGRVLSRRTEARSVCCTLEAPAALAKYIAIKGSICVDGISLTVNQVTGNHFAVNIVPHTLGETTVSGFKAGTRVNIEVDLLARYLERLLLVDRSNPEAGGITLDSLARQGFLGE
ncbi:MAG: riboflavin synthase [Gammaproteobacteria bacterium]|nr:riboflavin synthase [Gammaproteobacteria bacterium]